MAGDLNSVRRDAAALYNLAEQFQESCTRRESGQSYPEPAETFLAYCEAAAERTNAFLDQIDLSTERDRQVSQGKLQVLKAFWRQLHSYVKPVIDAHRLATPYPLLDLATNRLNMVAGLNGSRFITLLAPELMYFQSPHTSLKTVANQIALMLNCPEFPEKLGIVQIPYALSGGIFGNLLIFHELGHYIYEELSAQEYVTAVENAINAAVGQIKLNPERATFVADVLRNWGQEVFCDLVATKLIGPCFGLALAEFVQLLGTKEDDAWLHSYVDSHPAAARRYTEILRAVDESGWGEALAEADVTEGLNFMRGIAARSESDFWDRDVDNGEVVRIFVAEVIPTVRIAAQGLTTGVSPAVDNFREVQSAVSTMLLNGIVPSVGAASQSGDWSGHAVAVVNASFSFVMRDLGSLVSRVALPGSEAERWARLRAKVESWTLKAIEDFALLGGMDAAQ